MKKFILFCVVVFSLCLFGSCAKPVSSVYYTVTGVGGQCDVMGAIVDVPTNVEYTTGSNGASSGWGSTYIPYTSPTYNLTQGDAVHISIEQSAPCSYGATLTVKIFKDGVEFKAGTATGSNALTVQGNI